MVLGIACALESHAEAGAVPCGVYAAPFAVNLFGDESTFVEPDVCVICDPSKQSDRGCEGAPDFIAEVVSPSSRRMDYITKMARYEQAGVREYWVVDPGNGSDAGCVTVYRFESGDPAPKVYSFDEAVPVGIMGGLSIEVGKIVERARARMSR